MVINWATLAYCFTNLQKASTVKFKAVSFSCKNNERKLATKIFTFITNKRSYLTIKIAMEKDTKQHQEKFYIYKRIPFRSWMNGNPPKTF